MTHIDRLAVRLLVLAGRFDRKGYPWHVRVLDWAAGRCARLSDWLAK